MKAKRLSNEEMITSYIHEVTKRVPQKQRTDIELELRSLIEDQIESNNDQAVETILLHLGSPKAMADNYLEHKRYLIGPAYIDFYITLLKIVIPSVILALTIALTLSFVMSTDQTGIQFVLNLIGSWWSASLQVFAFLTIGFVVVEYVKRGKVEEESWSPSMLERVEVEPTKVKIGDSIAAIAFLVIGVIIFNVTPNLIAIHMFEGNIQSVPLLNEAVYPTVLLWINLGFIVSMVKELTKIIIRNYNKIQFIVQTILGMLSVVVAIFLLTMPNLIHPTLTTDLAAVGFELDFDLYVFLNRAKTILLYIIVVVFAIEAVTSGLKLKRK